MKILEAHNTLRALTFFHGLTPKRTEKLIELVKDFTEEDWEEAKKSFPKEYRELRGYASLKTSARRNN